MASNMFTCVVRSQNLANFVLIPKVLKLDTGPCARLKSLHHVRYYHLHKSHPSTRYIHSRTGRHLLQPYFRTRNIIGMSSFRLSSTVAESATTILEKIPEPPVPPPPSPPLDITAEAVASVTTEPSITTLGLGGWSPIGIVQHCLEYLHVDFGIPWWGSIIIGTIVVRTLIFPLVIISQRNAARLNNHLPQLQLLQLKMTEARQTGNAMEAARYAQELSIFMKEKNVNPLKNMIVPFAQAPVFITFFLGLRRMANAPVESMMAGGLFWFTDLTVPDQYYLLPILTSLTLMATIEVGADTARLQSSNMGLLKYVLRGLPVIILPFTINFPGAILCYWLSSNFISLLQVAFLRIPAVRQYFNIEHLVNHKPETLPVKPKGFVKGFKESWQNIQITKEIEDRARFDEVQFQKAGRAPIIKTYKHDPTQAIPPVRSQNIAAKKRDG